VQRVRSPRCRRRSSIKGDAKNRAGYSLNRNVRHVISGSVFGDALSFAGVSACEILSAPTPQLTAQACLRRHWRVLRSSAVQPDPRTGRHDFV
jgi:hypothetical protein